MCKGAKNAREVQNSFMMQMLKRIILNYKKKMTRLIRAIPNVQRIMPTILFSRLSNFIFSLRLILCAIKHLMMSIEKITDMVPAKNRMISLEGIPYLDPIRLITPNQKRKTKGLKIFNKKPFEIYFRKRLVLRLNCMLTGVAEVCFLLYVHNPKPIRMLPPMIPKISWLLLILKNFRAPT